MPVLLTAGAACLALNIYFEARSEPLLGQYAVAEVTLNRVASPDFPDTICEVVWERRQFSWTHDGKSDKPKNKDAWATALEVSTTMLDLTMEIEIVGPDVLFYHSTSVNPYWAASFDERMAIGTHKFYSKNGPVS
jgi:N-acetylmuramoyl-L-alanine amidase